ncbi:HIT domain-containing protein [Candidatus Saccharibacteria bacterium]|nr:HIT domain-containing protein [Candidatus Saccharibacteria bacterium]
MQDSIFTKIIKGEIPCHKVYEDEKTFAFLDIHPITPGHVLVVPKTQVAYLWDMVDDDYLAVMATVKKLSAHLRDTLGVPYVGLKVIGVDVPHAHVHIVPFTSAAEYARTPDMSGEPDNTALAAVAEKLKMEDSL